ARAAETIELRRALVRAVTRQKLDVFDRQEQLAAVILQLQAIVRRTGSIDGLEAEITPDAMFDMGDEIARCKTRCFLQEVLRAACACLAHHAVAEDVLLRDDGEIRRLETMLEFQNRYADRFFVQLQRIRPILDATHRRQTMI